MITFIDKEKDIFTLQSKNGDLHIDVSRVFQLVVLDRDMVANLWRILRHYAETGELCEVPPIADDARRKSIMVGDDGKPITLEHLEKHLGTLETILFQHADAYGKLAEQVYTLQQQHAPGHAHRANEPHAFGAVPMCVCGCSLDDHARDPQARAVVLGCEKCGKCEKFESAQIAYLVENAT